jgi:hypothetical protein
MIHFRHDNRIILSREVNITNCSVDETIQSPKTTIRRSLALCVHISFLSGDARGMVIFKGAGKNNFTFWMPMHPDWLRYENSKYA